MAASEMDCLWKLISNYDLTFDSESSDFTCAICKKVLVDAVQSNVCGCRYCYNCVYGYNDDGTKYCPGKKQFCHDEEIFLNINAFRNTMLNKQISKLKVNCPNQSCGSIVEFSDLIIHLGACEKQPLKCPYTVFGCDTKRTDKEGMKAHMNTDTLCHTEMLLDLIQNLRNEVKDLKSEFESLKVNSRDKDIRIVMLEDMLGQVTNDNEKRNGVELSKKEDDVLAQVSIKQYESLKNEIKKVTIALNENIEVAIKNKLEINSIQLENNKNETRVTTIDDQLKQMRTVIEGMEDKESKFIKKNQKQLDEQPDLIGDLTMKVENATTTINNLVNDIENMRETKQTHVEDMERKVLYWIRYNRLCPKLDVDFVWRVTDCSKKLDLDIFSESFYSNNYKLCLYLFLGSSSGNLYIYCYILKGSYDEKQQWPMRRAVTLSVVDQESLKAYKSETYEVSFNRPTRDKGGRVGSSCFMQHSFNKNTTSIMTDDSLIFSCVVNDLSCPD